MSSAKQETTFTDTHNEKARNDGQLEHSVGDSRPGKAVAVNIVENPLKVRP
jgi:hypothetical protein